MSMTSAIVTSVFPLMMIAAGIGDFLTMRIPNWLTGSMVVAFFIVAVIAGMPLSVMGWHVLAGLAFLVGGIILFLTIRFGGGDAKMIAAGALWVGWQGAWPFMFYTILCGGVLAMVVAVWAYIRMWQDDDDTGPLKRLFDRKIDIPYGLAIAGGGILAFPQTWWMQSIG